jgi:hypothetical protein
MAKDETGKVRLEDGIDKAWDEHVARIVERNTVGMKEAIGKGSLLGEFLRDVVAPLRARVIALTEEVNELATAEVERSVGINLPDGLVEAVALRVEARLKFRAEEREGR